MAATKLKSVLITGANRGLGLGLVKQLASQGGAVDTIIAACRNPSAAEELQSIATANQSVKIVPLEVINFANYPNFASNIGKILQSSGAGGLSALVNNAGIMQKDSLQKVTAAAMVNGFQINCVAPLLLVQQLTQLLKSGAKEQPEGIARVLNISAIMASLQGNSIGTCYPYRASKAALNMMTRSMAAELRRSQIAVVSLHPGWVKTDLGGDKAPMDIQTSAGHISRTLFGMSLEQSGKFLNFDGKEIPW